MSISSRLHLASLYRIFVRTGRAEEFIKNVLQCPDVPAQIALELAQRLEELLTTSNLLPEPLKSLDDMRDPGGRDALNYLFGTRRLLITPRAARHLRVAVPPSPGTFLRDMEEPLAVKGRWCVLPAHTSYSTDYPSQQVVSSDLYAHVLTIAPGGDVRNAIPVIIDSESAPAVYGTPPGPRIRASLGGYSDLDAISASIGRGRSAYVRTSDLRHPDLYMSGSLMFDPSVPHFLGRLAPSVDGAQVYLLNADTLQSLGRL